MATAISLNCRDKTVGMKPNDGHPPINVVPWIDGFYDNVRFLEWKDFEGKMLAASTEFHHAKNRNDLRHALGVLEVARSVLSLGPTNSSTFFPPCSSIPIAQILKLSAAFHLLQNKKRPPSLCLAPANLLQPGPLTRWKAISAQLTSDWTTVFLGEHTIPYIHWICAFNLLSPRANILVSENFDSTARISAKELCVRYNALFTRSLEDIKNNKRSNTVTVAAAIVAQALSGALSTRGGCVFLYNHDVGVAMKIVRNHCDKVVVKVSRPFYQNEEAGLIAAMVALSAYSMNRISVNSTAPAQMIERAEKIALSAESVQNTRQTSERKTKVPREAEECSPRKRARRSCPGESYNAAVLGANEARTLQPRVLLSSGNSGRVFLSTWNGKGVAIKEWNGATQEGLKCMLEEVAFLNLMRKEFTDLIGTVIPNVLLAEKGGGCDAESTKEDGPIIATEFVGEMVSRDCKSQLCFGESPNSYAVKRSDEREIYEAAMKGLDKLHGKGLLHGSVYLRNLRVERKFHEAHNVDATWKWRVWWIDFGRSKQFESDSAGKRFKKEREQCRKLFWTRAPIKM